MTADTPVTVCCVSCGEPVLGAANRCWKCAQPLDADSCLLPKTRRSPIPRQWLEQDATHDEPSPAEEAAEDIPAENTPAETAPTGNEDGQDNPAPRKTKSPFAMVAKPVAQTAIQSPLPTSDAPGGSDTSPPPASPFLITTMYVLMAVAVISAPKAPGLSWICGLLVIGIAVTALRTRARQSAFFLLVLACLLTPIASILYVRTIKIPMTPVGNPPTEDAPLILDEEP